MTDRAKFDVAVIGAGMAGLTCAQALVQMGYRVVVLEKSRGVGGRLATRRLHGTCADHGACYLSPQGSQFQALIQQWIEQGVVKTWTDRVADWGSEKLQIPTDRKPCYVSAAGMTAIAKTIAVGLEIRLSQRVDAINRICDSRTDNPVWQLAIAAADSTSSADVEAAVLILAVPAPQALALLQPLAGDLSTNLIHRLKSVRFFPSLSVMAGYPTAQAKQWFSQYPDVSAITFTEHPTLGYLGFDSSKRTQPTQPVFVIQSSAAFADRHLDTVDLQPAAQAMLAQAAIVAEWLATPEWMQIHRWRYALPQSPLADLYLAAEPGMALVCTGDWCGGRTVEAAFLSGTATAEFVQQSYPL